MPPILEGRSKEELDELKLKMEIEKLYFETTDKKKSWLYKNSAILIPSLLALATICTGIITGYFSATAIKLENQKHDLQDSIIAFQRKRDGLDSQILKMTKSNDSLLDIQRKIINDNNILKEDNKNLKFKVDSLIITIEKLSINPKAEEFVISTNSKSDSPMTITVIDLTGKLIYKVTTSESSVKIGEHFAPGIYFVRVEKDNQVSTKKLIKAK